MFTRAPTQWQLIKIQSMFRANLAAFAAKGRRGWSTSKPNCLQRDQEQERERSWSFSFEIACASRDRRRPTFLPQTWFNMFALLPTSFLSFLLYRLCVPCPVDVEKVHQNYLAALLPLSQSIVILLAAMDCLSPIHPLVTFHHALVLDVIPVIGKGINEFIY